MDKPKTIPFGSPPLVKPKTVPFKPLPVDPYAQMKQATQQQDSQSKIGGFFKGVGDLAVGAYKGAAHTVSSLESGSQKVLDAITKPVSEAVTGKPYQASPTLNETFEGTTKITPTNTAQKIGFGAEQVGEYFIPIGAEEKLAASAGKLVKEAPKIVQGAVELGTKAVASGGIMSGITAAQGGSAQDIKNQGIIGAAIPIVAKPLEAVGKALAEAFIPTSAKEAQLLQAYKAKVPFWERVTNAITGTEGKVKVPVTAGSTAFDKGIMGTESMIGVQAKRASKGLWNDLIDPALKADKKAVNIPAFFKAAKQDIIDSNPEFSRRADLLNALKAMKEDYKGVKDISLSQLQKLKEGWAKFVPEKAYRNKPIAGAFNDLKDLLSDKARNTIYTRLGPDIKQAYFDYGNLKGLEELGQKAMTGGRLRGGAGNFISAIKDMALVPISTVAGQTLYKIGNKIEVYGKPGIKSVEEWWNSLNQ